MTIRPGEPEPELRAPASLIADYLRRSISLSYLLGQAWTGRWFIIATTVVGLLYGVYMVHHNGPRYTAMMRISPAETDNSLGEGGGASSLLAGLTGAGGTVALPKFTQFMFAKNSVGVAQELDRKYDLLCRIYAGECDLTTHQWKPRTGVKETIDAVLARLAGLPDPNGRRTIEDLAKYIAGTVLAEENKNNSMVQIRYTNRKPEFAAQFLAAVVKAANDHVRAQSREQQKRYVEYLTQSAAKATNVEQRMAIDTLLLQEERQLMMTEVDVPYAAKILDGPNVEPVRDAKKIMAIYTIIGFLLGAIVVSCRDLLPRKWRVW